MVKGVLLSTGIAISMYYGLIKLNLTEIILLSILILMVTIPLIIKYVYRVHWFYAEPTLAAIILYCFIFNLYAMFSISSENCEDSFRAANIYTSIIFIIAYYYIRFSGYEVPMSEALGKALLISGSCGVFLLSVYGGPF
jgi:hypothetical protein